MVKLMNDLTNIKNQETLKIIAKNIKHFRTIKQLSQQQLEFEANLVTNYITNIEKCKKDVKISTLVKIATALDIEIIELFKKRENYQSKKRIDNKEKTKGNTKITV